MSHTTTATSKQFKSSQETVNVLRDIVLTDCKTLTAKSITTTYTVKREINARGKIIKDGGVSRSILNEEVEELTFELSEVTPKELAIYRAKRVPSFVLKVDDHLYHTSIPAKINFVGSTIIGPHKCSLVSKECRRLSAALDEEGGCAKVRNSSNNIERYPWIKKGYETFNTNHDSFVVVECGHYKPCLPKEKLPISKVNSLRKGLADFLYN